MEHPDASEVLRALNIEQDSPLLEIAQDILLYLSVDEVKESCVEWAEEQYSQFGRRVVETAWGSE